MSNTNNHSTTEARLMCDECKWHKRECNQSEANPQKCTECVKLNLPCTWTTYYTHTGSDPVNTGIAPPPTLPARTNFGLDVNGNSMTLDNIDLIGSGVRGGQRYGTPAYGGQQQPGHGGPQPGYGGQPGYTNPAYYPATSSQYTAYANDPTTQYNTAPLPPHTQQHQNGTVSTTYSRNPDGSDPQVNTDLLPYGQGGYYQG
ncbi:hypothetical protein C8R47DRAFT_1229216 [Mycena vitilis]|nr:hypothetical protein C8R47DRAFT_1229216 [Mycena vitilis]